MSRIGTKLVALPKGVSYQVEEGQLTVTGPKGSLARKMASGIVLAQEGSSVRVTRESDTPAVRANHGLMRSLLANMVQGVSVGFERRLEIIGVGYKAEGRPKSVVLNLGYSHPIEYPFPDGVSIDVEKGGKIVVRGIDKERVGQTAAEIRRFRSPDSYKGKGLRYEGEKVRLKAGKSGQ